MITLTKTAKPLHIMTDSEVKNGVDDWWMIASSRNNTPAQYTHAMGMHAAYAGEFCRRMI